MPTKDPSNQRRRTTSKPKPKPDTLPGLELVQPEEAEPEEADELVAGARKALRSKEPLELIALVSGLVAALDPRSADLFGPELKHHPTLGEFVEVLLAQSTVETTATLTLVHALIADDVLRARVTRELMRRKHRLPAWLSAVAQARIEPDVWRVSHVLGEHDAYAFGVVLPTGHHVTVAAYVDNTAAGIVDDAQATPEPLTVLLEGVRADLDQDRSVERVDPATARALLTAAIDLSAHTLPHPQTDSWPMSRPVVEWMLRMMPSGGSAPGRREWSETEVTALGQDFLASRFGAGLDDPDHHGLLQNLLWYGTDYGTGDPLRWGETEIRILLLDWFPRKVLGDPELLIQLPDLLRAFIRYAHERSGIRTGLTDEVLAAVDEAEPGYLQRVVGGPSRPEELLGALLGSQGLAGLAGLGLNLNLDSSLYEELEDEVGGAEQLAGLTAEPLPDEAFDWDRVPDDIRPVVEQILSACDGFADGLLDVEHRTAMRRLLARAASGDPSLFRRKASPARAAAAIAWLVCRANGTAGNWGSPLSVREVTEWFGVKGGVSQRAAPLLKAAGLDPDQAWGGDVVLGTPDLLVSERRAMIMRVRDSFAE